MVVFYMGFSKYILFSYKYLKNTKSLVWNILNEIEVSRSFTIPKTPDCDVLNKPPQKGLPVNILGKIVFPNKKMITMFY